MLTDKLTAPSLEQRRAWNAGASDTRLHARLCDQLAIFDQIEQAHTVNPAPAAWPLRVAFWNAERCKFLLDSARLLGIVNAEVNLLCEMDYGMARSAHKHTTAELARQLGQGYIFATEYVELGLGDERERAWHAGEDNSHGLHGAAIVAKPRLGRCELIRLETSGAWFDGRRGERRIGGRIALAAAIDVAGRPLIVVTVHLESHSDPEQRAAQTRVMLDAIDKRYAAPEHVLIGGDLNTNSASWQALQNARERAMLVAAERNRFADPVSYEPLFEVARSYRYDWRVCNAPGPTQRTRPDGSPTAPFKKLDWFLARGLSARACAIVPAVDAHGQAISDHELIAVTIEP